MDSNVNVNPHPDPWVDLLRPYVADVVGTLTRSGLRIQTSWLDPRDPRDATVVWGGGDGTLNSAAPGLVYTGLPLGVLLYLRTAAPP